MFDAPTLMTILLKLSFEEVLEKQSVCHVFYKVIADCFFWKQKVEMDFGITSSLSQVQKNAHKRVYFFCEESKPYSIKNIGKWGERNARGFMIYEPLQYFKRAVSEGNLALIKAYYDFGAVKHLKDENILTLLTIAASSNEWKIYWYFVDHYSPKSAFWWRLLEQATNNLLLSGVEDERIFRLIDLSGGPHHSTQRTIGIIKSVEFLINFYKKYNTTVDALNETIFNGIGRAQNVELFEKYTSSMEVVPLYIKSALLGAVECGHFEFVVYLREKYEDIVSPKEILFVIQISIGTPDALILKYALILMREKGFTGEIQGFVEKILKRLSKKELLDITTKWALSM